jgi:hypothetical protein
MVDVFAAGERVTQRIDITNISSKSLEFNQKLILTRPGTCVKLKFTK